MNTYRYPCTGNIDIAGFGSYLEEEIRLPRRNMQLFSQELSEAFGVPYISLVNSGSSANLVAALAMAEKIKAKGKPLNAVISAFTFPTTVSALVLAGFELTVVDTERGGFNMCVLELEKLRQPVSLIAVTHFLGFTADLKQLRAYADAHDAFILQDACESMELLSAEEQPCFQYGDITTWSFYHPHHLSSYGGGAVLCTQLDDFLMIDSLVHWGRACKCHIDESLCQAPQGAAHQFSYERVGVNVEISELNACFGRWQFRNWEAMERMRKSNYSVLYDRLKSKANLKVWEQPAYGGSLFVFPFQVQDGRRIDDIHEVLKDKGLETRTLMGSLVTQKAFEASIKVESVVNAQHMFETTLFVGIHQTISLEDMNEMASILCDIL